MGGFSAAEGVTLDPAVFFDRDPRAAAMDLLGKVLCHCVGGVWLQASIIEAEAYLLEERGSHASLGYTDKRKALFMPPGTIYMYYARGGDSFNVSCRGRGNAVLFKSGLPYPLPATAGGPRESRATLEAMHCNNPLPRARRREDHRLCSGQTLLCRALDLRVPDWNAEPFDRSRLILIDTGYQPMAIVRTTRLGIPIGRDEQLPYRFVDREFAAYCTHNPIPSPRSRAGVNRPAYEILPGPGA